MLNNMLESRPIAAAISQARALRTPAAHMNSRLLSLGRVSTWDIISSTGINTDLAVGQMLTVTGITSVNSSSSYVNALSIDGITTPVWWNGGSAPSDGGSEGVDMYTFNIIKTGSGTYHVVGNQTKTS